MAQTVLDSSNMGEFLETGKVAPFKTNEAPKPAEPEVKAEKVEKAAEPQVDDDGLTPEERATIGAKVDKIVNKKHRAMMEAKEQAKEAESFAEAQYRERKAAEKRAEEFEARLKELESRAAPQEREAKEPKREDFKDDAEYWDAKIDWKASEAVRKDRELRAEEDRAREAARLDAQRIERNKAFAKTVPDYEETVAALATEDLNVPGHIAQYLLESDGSPALMYHFAKNPNEFRRIAQLSPIRAIAAIGKLEASLEKPAPAPVKDEQPKVELRAPERPRAPEPIEPIAGNAGTVHKDFADMTYAERKEYWEVRDKASGSKRQRH